MTIKNWISAGALVFPMLAGTAYAQEAPQSGQSGQEEQQPSGQPEMVKMQDLPAPVKETVQRESQGKKVESMKKETENGKTTYDIELSSKDGKREQLEISESGKVIEHRPAQEKSKAKSEQGAPMNE